MLAEAERAWLAANADALDADASVAGEVVPRLAQAGLFGLGVPHEWGGQGGTVWQGIEAIADVAGQSLAAAFTFWGQRAFIEYLLQSPNAALRQRWLPPLLAGTQAGATGLSNAMKYLSGIESLGVIATALPGAAGWRLDGSVPWCTNLRPAGFVAAVAAATTGGGSPLVAALAAGSEGLVRSDDLDLIALRGSNTASLKIDGVRLTPDYVLHEDANVFLPQVRPAFLGLQCGLSIGLARAALETAAQRSGAGRGVLEEPLAVQQAALSSAVEALRNGLEDGRPGSRFHKEPAALFRVRLTLAGIVQQSLLLELQAGGGRAYHRDQPLSFARRWREAAFIPIVTPSVTQLQGALAAQAARQAAA
ncbi:acyl-CoA dehydrogenase family protein [uncultured Ramlibacter sp.]|uniref:acyl-CoA dehydrogenase family protein n=1 Tax=uncultured Ramlibacter sp. TaxID=260755 RepID=UPI0026182437|nr:acyl-CoA dehydrogenase family protein [uncultured Ramlibacter sp.]